MVHFNLLKQAFGEKNELLKNILTEGPSLLHMSRCCYRMTSWTIYNTGFSIDELNYLYIYDGLNMIIQK